MVKVRALVTIQGPDFVYAPKHIFEMETGKELDRVLRNEFVELYEGQDLSDNARYVGKHTPPPKFEDGVVDGTKDEKIDVIFKDDPGDVTPAKSKGKKGKK